MQLSLAATSALLPISCHGGGASTADTGRAEGAGPGSGAPYTNRLVGERSPYLLQHAYNPVDWYPWGEEAFEKAQREDKLIFLSIGYSTCHWCHVMERESFENSAIAALMNEHYISIKVDREERPDVDRVYMAFVQATTGGGGWPLNVWLTPELAPITGGTYFPPEDRWGRPGLPTVLRKVTEAWATQRSAIMQQGREITAELEKYASGRDNPMAGFDPKLPDQAFDRFDSTYDRAEGGFGPAPKFPRPVTLRFLSRIAGARRNGDEKADRALEMATFTLDKMSRGGIHDHLGGGFHRYSVDRFWHVPHFEKMLYDQAQLANAYLDAYQLTGRDEFANTARDILTYVRRDLTDPGGGFLSAEDADSLPDPASKEKTEGAFYVWESDEIRALLNARDFEIFAFHYGVKATGNVPGGGEPHGEFIKKNILIQRATVEETARQFKIQPGEVAAILAEARSRLFATREMRPRPHRDDKIITAWNGLMIAAFARASRILGEPSHLMAANRAAAFIEGNLYDEASGTLKRIYRGSPGNIEGFLDDHAYLIHGLIELYQASLDVHWLRWALDLQKIQDRNFLDAQGSGYFSARGGDDNILMRMKESYDGAEPSPNSISALNLARLAGMTGDTELRSRAESTLKAFGDTLTRTPEAMPQMLSAFDFFQDKPRQIIVAGALGEASTRLMLEEIYRHFLPNTIILGADGGEGQEFLAGTVEAIRAITAIDGRATAYICENFVCRLPTNDISVVAKLLEEQ